MNPAKKLAIEALENLRGDDLERMEFASRGRTPKEMQLPYGHSGMTWQQLLDHYRAKRREIDEAIEWVKGGRS